jgi:hypothetical protein
MIEHASMMYPHYIMAMTRTQISLSDDDRRVLDAVSRRTGLSMSALIRDAIHATYGDVGQKDKIRALLDVSFGAVELDASGEDLVDSIRSGRRLSDIG